MKNPKRIYAFIPARGGSKRILKKNLQKIAGRPLIQFTLDAAKKASLFEKIVVSTDDSEIEAFSIRQGVEVIKRPEKLAQDSSPTIDSIIHFINIYEINDTDIIVLLQPTSPLRNEKHIIETLNKFISGTGGSLVSVMVQKHPIYWSFNIENGFLNPVMGTKYLFKRSQDLPESYIPNGAIYIATAGTIRKKRTFYCDDTMPYIMNREDSVDIDEPIDMELAEFFIISKEKKMHYDIR